LNYGNDISKAHQNIPDGATGTTSLKKDSKIRILFVCSGNTCRSPMAKVILEQQLKAVGKLGEFEIDSAAYGNPTLNSASDESREVIKIKYGKDLLASHRPKKITPGLIFILVMTDRIKNGLPQGKVFTLKEFAGGSGDIVDPFGQGQTTYLSLAEEISETIAKVIPRLMQI
jgi:protein-tyrosine-phosphatase